MATTLRPRLWPPVGPAPPAYPSSPIWMSSIQVWRIFCENVDYLIVSRDIPSRLTGEPDLEMALRLMQRRYGCRLTAATLGHDGVLAWDGKHLLHAPAFRVPVVDTTGAGDIFHAGFIYGLLQGLAP